METCFPAEIIVGIALYPETIFNSKKPKLPTDRMKKNVKFNNNVSIEFVL